jgi:ribosomal protein S18 acetylase RimI-like enzyme
MKHLRPSSHREAQLREAGEDDGEKFFSLFATSRDDLLAAVSNWDEAQQEAFMRIQFQAQRDQYRCQYPYAHWDMIIRQNEIIGQILVAPLDDELRLVDVSLLPEFRNRGIGTALLRDLLDKAASENRRVTLHVLQDNPAVRLYERLGFTNTRKQGIYQRMEWAPSCGASTGDNTQFPASVS